MVAMLSVKPWGVGMSVAMVPKRSPMVSILYQSKAWDIRYDTAVTTIMAISAPGRRFEMRGVSIMMKSDTSAVHSVTGEMLPRLLRYMPHLGMN